MLPLTQRGPNPLHGLNVVVGSVGQVVIDAVRADPEPYVFIRQLHGHCPVFERHARGPDFLLVPITQLLELQGGIFRIHFSNANCLSARLRIPLGNLP